MRMLVFQVLIALAILASLEAAARVAHTVMLDWARPSAWYEYSSDVGWDRVPNFAGFDDCGEHRAFDRQGLFGGDSARLEQKQGQFRALFMGDSNTYGHCLGVSETFVEIANRLLPGSPSINLGINGYTSYQGYRALQKYGGMLKPSMIFISFNFNDRRLVLDPALADGASAFQRLRASSSIWRLSDLSYLFRVAVTIVQKIAPPDPAASGYMPEVSVDKLKPRVDADNYRRNLTDMVRWAQQRGIAVAFILLGDNPDQTYFLRNGIRALTAGKYQEAIAQLNVAKDKDSDYYFSALARLYLARAYEAAALKEEARQALYMKDVVAGVHGGYPIVLDTEYHEIMREVGERFSVPVIDAAGELSKSDFFFDQCHFDARGHEIVARLVVNAIQGVRANGKGFN